MYINIYKCIIIHLINFVTVTISFVLNVAGDLPDFIELDNNDDDNNDNNNNDNDNNNNNNNNK